MPPVLKDGEVADPFRTRRKDKDQARVTGGSYTTTGDDGITVTASDDDMRRANQARLRQPTTRLKDID